MNAMTWHERAREIAADRDSGASELLARLLPVLDESLVAGPEATRDVARIVCRGQPAMASLWNACAAAVVEERAPGTFARRREEMLRASRALTRAASSALLDLLDPGAGRLVLTVSYSGGVASALIAAAAKRPLDVLCAEGRPRFEGRRLAERLAGAGVPVRLATDAALTSYLDRAQSFVCGADAIFPAAWINKVGTHAVAAAASFQGVPTYVIAARDKAADPRLAPQLTAAGGPAAEVWERPPSGVGVENPYFERIPAELATLFLTDVGPIDPTALVQLAEPRGELDLLLEVLGNPPS